ncbi:alpha/beta fold hydrolase [Cytobacillus gottheilii]
MGKLKPPDESFTPGEWFLGSIPSNVNHNKPPIVFVQGRNGSAKSWYEDTEHHGINDMYTKAYEAGYQTVFVQLHDAAGDGSATQYDNGELLAGMLAEIHDHFGGKKVNIVAHSKGGPDTQAALVHYGAHPYVGKVITLGSPHHGTHLADLSNSWYAGWLGSLLGQNDEGTFSLQTGEMAQFRAETDAHANILKNAYYTVAGTHRGPAFSALWMGGQYLSSHGANDGLVNEWSTKLPYAAHLFTDASLDHDHIRVGGKVFSRIEPYLRNSAVSQTRVSTLEKPAPITANSSEFIHGGPLDKQKKVKIPFYMDGRSQPAFQLYTASKDIEASLVSPSGKVYQNIGIAKQEGFSVFHGAEQSAFERIKVEEGVWSFQITSYAEKDAYFFMADLNETLQYSLSLPGKVKQGDKQMELHSPSSLKNTKYHIKVIDRNGNMVTENTTADDQQLIPKVKDSGVYNLTIEVTGTNTAGKKVTRTIVRSVYIEKE